MQLDFVLSNKLYNYTFPTVCSKLMIIIFVKIEVMAELYYWIPILQLGTDLLSVSATLLVVLSYVLSRFKFRKKILVPTTDKTTVLCCKKLLALLACDSGSDSIYSRWGQCI